MSSSQKLYIYLVFPDLAVVYYTYERFLAEVHA
jgi:hypothetical protein